MVNVGKIQTVKKNLRWWSKILFGNITRLLVEKKELLKMVETMVVRGGNVDRVLRLKNEISYLLIKEEKLWHQRSLSHWIKSLDKNTSFFFFILRLVIDFGEITSMGFYRYFILYPLQLEFPFSNDDITQRPGVDLGLNVVNF